MSIWTDVTDVFGAIGSDLGLGSGSGIDLSTALGSLSGDLGGVGGLLTGPGITGGSSAAGRMPAVVTAPTRGYHLERRGKNAGKYVRNRRMNPLNVHALRRALRRAEGFIRIEKRVDKIVNRAARYAGRARSHGFVRGGRSRGTNVNRGRNVTIVEE